MRRWRPGELAPLLRAHQAAPENQGLALERLPCSTLIAALGFRPGEAPASPDKRNILAAVLQDRGIASGVAPTSPRRAPIATRWSG
jgi:hypothetical protein